MNTTMETNSSNFNICKIPWSHVHEQTIIGTGGFCNVMQVHVNFAGLEEKRLALKRLKPSLLAQKNTKNDKKFISATSDLVIEGQMLSKVQHPNIVALHGVCEGDNVSAFTETTRGHFLVTDLLEDTLKDRLRALRNQMRHRRRRHFFLPSRSLTSPSAVSKRIETIAIGVGKGLEHLHQNNIVWRDLKPDNIGFDVYGTPKIFDLGFAREVGSISKEDGAAGTLRYLAPEVVSGNGEHEPTAADVYAFGVLLWELCTLEKPFEEYQCRNHFVEDVVYGGYRPSLYRPALISAKSGALRSLIAACWNPNPKLRPSMSDVVKSLQNFVTSNNEHSTASRRKLLHTNKKEVDGSKRVSIKSVMKILGFKHPSSSSNKQTMRRRRYFIRWDTCDTDSTCTTSHHTANIEY